MSGLPLRLRRRLEDGYHADLGDVVVHSGPIAMAACRSRMARGMAIGRHILIACDDPEDPRALPIVAHEVAHVVQKRHTGPVYEAAAEREARLAAATIVAGGRLRLTASSRPDRISHWGEVGHYYTVYLVMLAAGLSEQDAASVAFYAQLPDEALELDAIPAAGHIIAAPGLAWGSWEVQIGLHALSGLSQTTEFGRRIKIFDEISPALPDFLLTFGLACHPFGDCYAHQKNGVMYTPPLGHLFDSHGPDTITAATFDHYASYVTVLHGVAQAKFQVKQSRMRADALVQRLRRLVDIGSDAAQALYIRSLAASLPGMTAALAPYDPLASEARPFWEVHWSYPAYFQGLRVDALARARTLAREWVQKG
ncbi:DUF4157 domain-containing protein [Roseomonas hellenica]|uniref:DUF4157 domain-containing protein n=1 Tax=Plastoroseomonas hellenica TaxID=2687306 RepID=A0ABS5F7Z6_9PROT|nr:DUF4157 domain-containing protein [Plastoroseomonas hellenica]MBR0668641.1 DUF4157 domain-containing protein [Plastoroseomonas hellenica]